MKSSSDEHGTHTILIVNDMPDQLEMAGFILRKAGYDVLTANNGREGLDIAVSKHPDLVMSDVSMPSVNGFEMCRLIRANGELRAIPILLVSALRKDAAGVVEGLQAGADDYLEAPYDPLVLIARVARLLERRRANAELERRVSERTAQLESVNRSLEREIADRKRTGQKLHESEERYRLLVDGVKDYAIFMLDTQGRIVSWNQGAERIKGYRAEEIIGEHFSRFYTAEDIEQGKPELEIKVAAEEGRYEEEGWRVRKDGTRFFANVLITALKDEAGALRGFSKVTRDITEREQAEESLRLFESAIEQTNEAIAITTTELDLPGPRIIFVNPAFTRMTGYVAAEVIGKALRIRQGSETDRAVLDELREKLGRGEASEGMALNYRKDGSEFYMEWRVDPIRNERGEVTHFVAVQRDVTERVRAKEARMQLQRQLIAAQEEERRRISRELHDQIGQYLPALMLGLKALKETGQTLPDHATQVERLQETTIRISHDVQNLARELRPAALDEFGLTKTLVSHVEEWSQRHSIAVDFHRSDFGEDARLPPHVETTLYRIAQEALTNILKHAAAQNVSIILERRRRGVKMIIEDDGTGFEVEAVMKLPPAGRRLGLLGMRERVALINGSLQIESTLGVGTTIVVNLPISNEEGGDTRE